MSESTRKEMLEALERLMEAKVVSNRIVDSIRRLISIRYHLERVKPKVSREFVEECVNEMERIFMQGSSRGEREWFIVKRILKEAGVEVAEKEASDE